MRVSWVWLSAGLCFRVVYSTLVPMRVTVGASGHFHRAPTASKRGSGVTGKIGQRSSRSARSSRAGSASARLMQSTTERLASMYESSLRQAPSPSQPASLSSNDFAGFTASTKTARSKASSAGTAPLMPRNTNVDPLDRRAVEAARQERQQRLKDRVKRDPLAGSASWKGDIPNVFLKELHTGRRVKLRELVEGKVGVLDFWLTQVGQNKFTSMDA